MANGDEKVHKCGTIRGSHPSSIAVTSAWGENTKFYEHGHWTVQQQEKRNAMHEY